LQWIAPDEVVVGEKGRGESEDDSPSFQRKDSILSTVGIPDHKPIPHFLSYNDPPEMEPPKSVLVDQNQISLKISDDGDGGAQGKLKRANSEKQNLIHRSSKDQIDDLKQIEPPPPKYTEPPITNTEEEKFEGNSMRESKY
jgi:hypothetical protein